MKTLRPETDLLKYWRWHWAVWMIIVCVPLLILALGLAYPANLVLGISFAVAVLIFILIRIYLPLYYDTLTYTIEDDLVMGTRGVFWKKRVTVPFRKITNIDISQGPVQRLFDLGTIHVQTAGAAGAQAAVAELRIEGMKDFDALRDEILQLLRAFYHQRGPVPADAAQADAVTPADAAATDTAGWQAMLDELRAIRSLLEQRQ
ncbi:MAG: PH domain-containing protein [Bacteroidota bacterium]|nr:PH domain-containing protein [Bacteroidota bacterium]